MLRVLSARAQIRTFAQLAQEHDWTALLLKGGAAVAGGETIDLNDVDVLVAPDRTDEVAEALDALGYEQHGADVPSRHHLAGRFLPNALRIEVHRAVKSGQGLETFLPAARPIPHEPPLLALGPADNLRYLLLHATIEHPERIGRLRDSLLIAHALRECSPEDISAVDAELSTHDQAAVIRAVLRFARSLATGSLTTDPFGGFALRRYIIHGRFGNAVDGFVASTVMLKALRIAALGRVGWWRAFVGLHRIPAGATPPLRMVARAHRRSRWLGNAVWIATRHVIFAAASLLAAAAIGEARWIQSRRDRRPEHR